MWWDFLIVAAIVAGAAAYLVWRRVGRKGALPECASCGCSCRSRGQDGPKSGTLPCTRPQGPIASG